MDLALLKTVPVVIEGGHMEPIFVGQRLLKRNKCYHARNPNPAEKVRLPVFPSFSALKL